jgi:hypothetical protein
MKTLACTLALFLGLGITFAQNQENPDVRYHKDKLPHLDSLIHENYFPGMNNWFHDKNPELSKLNKRMEEFEKLIEKKMLRIEELLDQLDEAEKEKSKY